MSNYSFGHGSTARRRLRLEKLEDRRVLTADFSGNEIVGAEDLDIWKTGFGTAGTATQSQGDANGDMNVDGSDFLLWQRTFGQSTAPPRAPQNVHARAIGALSIEVTWEASPTATSYYVFRIQPDTETQYTQIASGVTATTYTDTGLIAGTLYEYRVIAHRNPDSAASQPAYGTAERSNLTAYRPQFVQDSNNPVNTPIYDPLPRSAVWEIDEMNASVGPGIRINHDDDNSNAVADAFESGVAIPLENDLIEMRVDRLPGSGNLVLVHGGRLKLYYDHAKQSPVPTTGGTTAALTFNNDIATVFVEYISTSHGTDTVSLVDQATSMTIDSARFHSFRSLTVVFGGRGQSPVDSDGDGSMGDPRGAPANREGIFDLATGMYNTGWDVLPFDEADYTILFESVAEREIKNAIDNRFVSPTYTGGVSIMGYSQGGGVVQEMIEFELAPVTNPTYLPIYAVYLDAVMHDFGLPETDWPDRVYYLLNIYQQKTVLGGGDIDDTEVLVPAVLEEINVTFTPGWNAALDHSTIDDDLQVLQYILFTQNQLMLQ